jgi:hypothetical protein
MRASHIAAAFGAPRRLRWASSLNRWHGGFFTHAGTQLNVISRKKVVVGSCDFDRLRFSAQGRRQAGIENSVNIQQELDLPNSFAIDAMYLERGAASVQITWGGVGSKTITPGTIDAQCDDVLPAAFGLTKFAQGDVLWLRCVTSVSAAGMISPQTTAYASSGEGAYVYDPATATVSAVSSTGAITASGSGFAASVALYSPLVLGIPINGSGAQKFVTGVGDSILAYIGDDTSGSGANGPYMGAFQRSLVDANFVGNPVAGCNIGIPSGVAAIWLNGAPCGASLLKYGNTLVEEYGTNGIYTAGNQSIWAAAKAAGNRVIRTKLISKAGSSNGWSDTAGQTKFSGWEVGGLLYVWNEGLASLTGYDTLVDLMQATGAASDRYLWDPTAGQPTGDGVHPYPVKHEAMGAMLRAAY